MPQTAAGPDSQTPLSAEPRSAYADSAHANTRYADFAFFTNDRQMFLVHVSALRRVPVRPTLFLAAFSASLRRTGVTFTPPMIHNLSFAPRKLLRKRSNDQL